MMIERDKIEFIAPTLHRLLNEGTVYIKDGEFYGKASDGVEVSFGDAFNIPGIERYLKANPLPEKW